MAPVSYARHQFPPAVWLYPPFQGRFRAAAMEHITKGEGWAVKAHHVSFASRQRHGQSDSRKSASQLLQLTKYSSVTVAIVAFP